MPSLVLGPLLRYVGEDHAVIWVETDGPCEVEVLGARERTFHVEGHHYALVHPTELESGAWHEYEVRLDGELVWPSPGSNYPPSQFRTYPKDGPLLIAFGSCRVSAPHEPPWTLGRDEDRRGRKHDALRTMALRMTDEPRERWPDVLLLLGDQVYADEPSPATEALVESRRDPRWPEGLLVVDFEEYTALYREAWSEPALRWLLSTVSTAMIFDDHDVHDDWNISAAWRAEMRSHLWWQEHIAAALMSYWIYQHLGNLSPRQHEPEDVLREVQEAEDGGPVLRDFARRADRGPDSYRWSYCRDLGDTRLVVIDSRAGRVLDEGRRSMLDEAEWEWLTEQARGGFDHLLLASSLPFLLAPGMSEAEAWSEAVCGGAWGRTAARAGEWLRRTFDLEAWPAFRESFDRLAELQRSVGAGERGPAPASVVTLGGDVHHAYLCELAFPRGAGVESAVWHAVCSPVRNPLDRRERRLVNAADSRVFSAAARLLARAAGVPAPPIRCRLTDGGPWFDNVISTLEVDGRRLDLRIEKAVPTSPTEARLETVLDRRLA